MKSSGFSSHLWAGLALVCFACPLQAQESISEIMRDPAIDWRDPVDRARAVERIKDVENRNLQKARAIARQQGKPLRVKTPDGKVRELEGLDEDGELRYVETRNANAAISTGANLLHTSPYSLTGSGLKVGVWDADSALVTHQEFNDGPTSRVINVNAQPTDDHATHVTGTIAAFGVKASAKGMAPGIQVDSYDWTNDDSEMAAAGAFAPGQFGTKVYLSNHSYGFSYGWRYDSVDGRWEWSGTGTDQNAYDADFGQYSSVSVSMDSIAFNSPYYLIFWAAGNENNDGPNNGNTVTLNGGSPVTYNSSIHPQNDGDYRNGFETVGDESVSKNIIVVGAANDAVTSGQRDPSKATIASFSSTGPTDDGRIKPDLVANGMGLDSPVDTGVANYGSKSGTSMASPNACGSAALLVALYRDLFGTNAAMRSSTLKGLLIHTATDRGNPGPDYTYGWGLVNVKSAADLLKRQADFPDLESVIEDQLSTTQPSKSYTFAWDGVSPIKATLCWTDPAGSGQSAHDDRSPDLVNNLNLKLIAPNGTEYFPYVMPFVGTWTVVSMSLPATTGVNNVDNVEQVLVQTPGQAGAWQAVVTHAGALANNQQNYGLIISGAGTAGAVAFNPSSYSISENGGAATITVERIGGTSGAVSVDYATADGTATAGSDYTAVSGTLNWVDGESGPKTFTVPITNDGVSEAYEETVSIQLSNTVGTTIGGTGSATLTIRDDEPLMAVTAPNGGEQLPVNTSYNITWVSSVGGNVRIELLRNGINYTTIAASTPNDGSFSWTVPIFAPTGADYRIRITSLSGGDTDESNASFAIDNQQSGGNIYTANMDSNPGWTLQGAWAYGVPTGSSGDPSSGKTGSNVIGYNLNGAYTNNLAETHATTSAIDCSGRTGVTLSFYRWLGIESSTYDDASISVSNNGTTWVPVWAHSGGTFTDPSWQYLTYDISAVADQQATVYIRWTMGATDSSVTYCGWNIDDVLVSGLGGTENPAGEVAFSSATYNVAENGGAAVITVNRIGGTAGAISVDYATSDGTALAGSDYSATSGTLNWANGDGASKSFTIPITNDSDHEDPLESIVLTLTNTVGATIADPFQATLEIQDDDNTLPAIYAGQDRTILLADVVPWSPAETTTALWLDADDAGTITLNGSTVTEWRDKSGNNRHASQSTASYQPTATPAALNGRQALSFDGSSDFFSVDLDFMAGASHSAFVVLADVATYSNIYGAANGSQGSNSLHVGFSNGTNYRMNYWGHDYGPAITSNFNATGSILNYVWNVGSPKRIYANGFLEGSGHNALAPGTMSGGGRIGKVVTHPHLGAKIAEIIILAGTVATEERERLEGYLAHKWGLTARLPANHPYKSEIPGGSGMVAEANLDDATASDADGDPFTTDWQLFDGPAAMSFGDESAVNTTATFTEPGIYTLRLSGDDGRGTSSDDVVVTVGFVGLDLAINEASISENGGTGNATVSRFDFSGDLVVNLSSDDISEATVPASVTILDGQTSANFTITAQDDGIADGTRTVTITATSTGNPNATATIDITDDDVATLTLDLAAASIGESDGAGATTATVTRNTDTTNAMVVNLASSDISEATVPATVTIAAGQSTSPPFTIDAIDDSIVDGTQVVTLTASSAGHVEGTDALDVTDDVPITLTVVTGAGGDSTTGGGLKDPDGSPYAITATAAAEFSFANWSVTAGSATIDDENVANTFVFATSDATVQANFAAGTYTVTYNGNGGDGGSVPVDASSPYGNGSTVTVLGNTGGLTRTGHTFTGWNTASDGSGTAYQANDTFNISSNTTLYAQWTINTYTVTYDDNGSDGGTAPVDASSPYDHGAIVTVLGNTGGLTKSGHTFDGWNTASDGSGADYAEGATFAIESDVTLHAQWNSPPTVAAGPDQTVYLTGAEPWTPAEIATAAWYDAADAETVTESGGAVSGWNDKSGNGRHAAQTNNALRPVVGSKTIGGKNAIDFHAANSQSLNIPALDVIGKEVWGVFFIDDYATTASQLLLGGGGNVQIGVNSSTQKLRLWAASNPYSADTVSTATVPVSTPAVAGWLAHTDTKKFSINGVLETTTNTYVSPRTLSPTYIGRGQYAYMDGVIGEIVITDATLSLDDRRKMEGYLAHKWGLAANLPADHPYKESAPGSPTAVANLDGTIDDAQGDPFTSNWSVVSGPAAVTFGDASAEDTTATFTAAGTYVLELTADDALGQGADTVTIQVQPAGPGPVDHFEISAIASPQSVGTPITGITLTALDANQNTATSFNGTVSFGGTGGFSGTSASFTNGVLTGVEVTPTVAGTDLTLTVDDGAGHTGSVVIATIQSVYDAWSGGTFTNPFTDTAFSSNPDNDSLTNLQEFAFGTDPTVATTGSIAYVAGGDVTGPGLPVALNLAAGEGVDFRAVFGRRKDYQAAGLTYTVQFSAGLDIWVDSTATPTVLTGTESTGDIEAVSVPYPFFIPVEDGFAKPTFFRVGVSGN